MIQKKKRRRCNNYWIYSTLLFLQSKYIQISTII